MRDAGLSVIEYEGWQTRSRSSGGFAAYPLCVMWHHTASPASWNGQKDADYIATGDSDAPLANLYIDRAGTVYVIAAGATNTNGKGKAITFSRGTVPADGMNTRALGVEMGNDGVGEMWPEVQVDAMFTISNVCNSKFGNRPDDLCTHNFYAPDRKIDPARAEAVAGRWAPLPCNSSGSWDRAALQAQALARWNGTTDGSEGLGPEIPEGEGMARQLVRSGSETAWHAYVCFEGGKYWLPSNEAIAQCIHDFGYDPIKVESAWMQAAGPVIGPNPTPDAWGIWDGVS